jgi:hypothetical protein
VKNAVIALVILVSLAIVAGAVAILLLREQATVAVEDRPDPKLPSPRSTLLVADNVWRAASR